ncbi:Hpt domain-containing protein [Neorhodopirellula lusitana]|uniref:Hpt domain-containing protein n=1 Tax=Neorhodopirellula lusitana TaxID=445327 RepID=UPI00384C779B
MTDEMVQRFSVALARLAGDEDLLIAMATMVTDDAPEVIVRLEQQLEQTEMEEAAASAHKLKGMLSTFETDSPVAELEEVVHAARGGNSRQASESFQACRAPIHELLREIAALKN